MMTSKIMATLTTLAGSMAAIYALFSAAGYDIPQPLQTAITGVVGLGIAIAGIWLNPAIPQLGPSEPQE